MSIATSTAVTLPLVIPYQPMRMSVADYHRMIAIGELTKNRRIELLKGVMVEKMPQNPLHTLLVQLVQKLLDALLPASFHARNQAPVTLADSEPEPDVSVARGTLMDYATRHPSPTEVPLVVEIAYSSLVTDRFKGEIYAEARVPLYWIVNLRERRVEVYSQPAPSPTGSRYASYQEYRAGDIVPVELDGQVIGQIPASELLPIVEE